MRSIGAFAESLYGVQPHLAKLAWLPLPCANQWAGAPLFFFFLLVNLKLQFPLIVKNGPTVPKCSNVSGLGAIALV